MNMWTCQFLFISCGLVYKKERAIERADPTNPSIYCIFVWGLAQSWCGIHRWPLKALKLQDLPYFEPGETTVGTSNVKLWLRLHKRRGNAFHSFHCSLHCHHKFSQQNLSTKMDECHSNFSGIILDTHFSSSQNFAVHAHLHLIWACFKVHVTRKQALLTFGPV